MDAIGDGDRCWISRLAELADGLTRCVDARQAAELAARAACLAPSETALVFQAGQGSRADLLAAAGPLAAAMASAPWSGGCTFPEWVLRTETLTVSTDVALDTRTSCLRERGMATGSAVGLPVRGGGRTRGVLVLVRPVNGQPAEDDLAGLRAVANMLGMAMEQGHLRETAEEQVRQLVALQEVTRLLTSAIDSESVLTIIVDVAASLFNLDLCCLLMYDRKGDLRVQAARGLEGGTAAGLACPAGLAPDAGLFRPLGYLSAALLPVSGRDEPLGYLAVGSRETRMLDQSERSPLRTWASLAGIALENSRWMAEAEGAQQDTVEALFAVLEAQGAVRPGLARKRAGYASAVAARLGLEEREVRDLYLAALLTDVPMTGSHAGGFQLGSSPRLQRVWQALRGQSERWDGKGPDGLKGEAIPIGARILAVVRAYGDAMTPAGNREPPSPVAALLQVKAGTGQDWDPRVVSALEMVVWSTLSLAPTALPPSSGCAAPGPPAGVPPQPAPPLPQPGDAHESHQATGQQPVVNMLTQREQEILALVAQGLSNREIAARLFVSEATVKTHVSRVLQKLGLPDRTKAAVYALQSGAQAMF